jgi:hypothetical protein
VADRGEEVGEGLDRHRSASGGEAGVDEDQQADQLARGAENREEGEGADRDRRPAEPGVEPEQEVVGGGEPSVACCSEAPRSTGLPARLPPASRSTSETGSPCMWSTGSTAEPM